MLAIGFRERNKIHSILRCHNMQVGESSKFYIHGSVHRDSNWTTVQQNATVFSLSHICRQLYMFRVLTHVIRSSYNCNYSFRHWSTVSATIRSRC